MSNDEDRNSRSRKGFMKDDVTLPHHPMGERTVDVFLQSIEEDMVAATKQGKDCIPVDIVYDILWVARKMQQDATNRKVAELAEKHRRAMDEARKDRAMERFCCAVIAVGIAVVAVAWSLRFLGIA